MLPAALPGCGRGHARLESAPPPPYWAILGARARSSSRAGASRAASQLASRLGPSRRRAGRTRFGGRADALGQRHAHVVTQEPSRRRAGRRRRSALSCRPTPRWPPGRCRRRGPPGPSSAPRVPGWPRPGCTCDGGGKGGGGESRGRRGWTECGLRPSRAPPAPAPARCAAGSRQQQGSSGKPPASSRFEEFSLQARLTSATWRWEK